MSLAIGHKSVAAARSFPAEGSWSRAVVLLALGWAAILALFWRDTANLADIYWNSSVFEHCILVLPIIGWMVWQRWPDLRQIVPQAWAGGLLWIGGGVAAWIVGFGAEISVARHFGLVVILQGLTISIVGPNVGKALLFPLCYSFFLVPLGDQLVPPLQLLTADMSMVMLDWVNIPAVLDGIFITTPTGYFRVAESCAGVNFLIAMVALGTMVAHVCFESWTRRAVFMAACVLVPIIANGIRAWGTIVIAHYQGIEFAAGFDHVFYGWFFFAFVLAVILGAAWPFFDRGPQDKFVNAAHHQRPFRFAMQSAVALGAALALCLPAAMLSARAADGAELPQRIFLPEVAGWQPSQTPQTRAYWPHFRGVNHHIMARYTNADGAIVDLFVAVYDRQESGRELLSVNQGAVDPVNNWVWSGNVEPFTAADGDGKGERVTAPGPVLREVATFYRLRGTTTSDETTLKWLSLHNRLLGGDQRAVAILVSAEVTDTRDARADVQAFINAVGPIGPMADSVSGLSQEQR